MSDEKVIVTKSKLDSLATSISNKSGVVIPLTIAQMKTAVDGISTGGGSITIEEIPNATGTTLQITTNGSGGGSTPSLQTKSVSYTPTTSAQTATVTADTGYDGLEQVNVSVGAIPSGYIIPSGTKTISANGTGIDVTNFAAVDVNVSSGGGTPSATQHSIYFEFSDETNTTITAYWDDSFISNAITATTPTTYGAKTVTLAQLDGVTWYEVSSGIPLNTELVDYSAVTTNRNVGDNGTITTGEAWECVTDYIPIDPSMTFTFICRAWYNIGFYDSNKSSVRVVISNEIAGSTITNDFTHGTLTPSVIPSSAAYVVLSGNSYALNSNYLSLIRTA